MGRYSKVSDWEIFCSFIVFCATVWYGPLVLRDAWNWFLSPLLGLTEIGWKTAFLCGVFVGLFKIGNDEQKQGELKEYELIGKYLAPPIGFGFAHLLFWWLT